MLAAVEEEIVTLLVTVEMVVQVVVDLLREHPYQFQHLLDHM